VKVGPGDTAAQHRVDEPSDITTLLQQLVAARRAGS
jgi:trehalose 6-phosphate phosphatase